MIEKEIIFSGQRAKVACDAKCEKAWGSSTRPKVQLSDHEDDYAYLADGELGMAPDDPGTDEGGHGKPQRGEDRLNKWCVRECERCVMSNPGEADLPLTLEDFSERVTNMKNRKG